MGYLKKMDLVSYEGWTDVLVDSWLTYQSIYRPSIG